MRFNWTAVTVTVLHYSLSYVLASSTDIPVPIVIWHGLGDRYDAPGLVSLKGEIEQAIPGSYVHLVRIEEDGSRDQRATFFGSASAQVQHVCEQLQELDEIMDPSKNPSGRYDAVGFSQGGQLLRAVVEVCGPLGKHGVTARNLITLGSQHLGISALPPCPPDSGPFSACRLMHLSLVREGLYSSWAQHNLIPAQYVRDQARINQYLAVNEWLRDINNEREGDRQVGREFEYFGYSIKNTQTQTNEAEENLSVDFGSQISPPRNATYKRNLQRLDNLVLIRFNFDATVVPPHSAHFTLPVEDCSRPIPACYAPAMPIEKLPLFADGDYIGLRGLDERHAVHWGICQGRHMEIDAECMVGMLAWLGKAEGSKDEAWQKLQSKRPGSESKSDQDSFVMQNL